MLRRFFGVSMCVLFAAVPTHAQEVKQIKVKEMQWYCNFSGADVKAFGNPEASVYTFSSNKEAEDAVSRVVRHTGVAKNFVVRAASVPNALATIVSATRYVLYNADFMARVADATKNDWASISILAHEIGHHLNGHTIQPGGSRPVLELEADKYSGFVLFNMGATLDDAQRAMRTLAPETATVTHPARADRIAAIAAGWQEAKALRGSTPIPKTSASGPKPQPTSSSPPPPPQPPSPKFVIQCNFAAEPGINYFVTASDEIVGVLPNGARRVVGRKMPSQMPAFAWMYTVPMVSYGVTHVGQIVSSMGVMIGACRPI